MKSKHELLMIGLGGPKKGPSPSDDDDGMEYGADDEGQDQDQGDDEHESVSAAKDLIDALHSKDAQAVVDAFRALDYACSDDDKPEG